MKLKTEKWKSNQNQSENHYFVPGKRNEYIAGFNPKYFSKDKVKKILSEIKKSDA